MTPKTRQELFDYMSQEHDVSLLETDMEELENIIVEEYRSVLEELILRETQLHKNYNNYKANRLMASKAWEKATDLLTKAQT